jgi:hypothetical protein
MNYEELVAYEKQLTARKEDVKNNRFNANSKKELLKAIQRFN